MSLMKKIIVSFLTGMTLAISYDYVFDSEIIYADDDYNILLSAETVEVDINDIPENREIKVGISIDNNPGFLALCFLMEIDNRISFKEYYSFDFDYDKFIVNTSYFSDKSISSVSIITHDENTRYFDNSNLLYLKLLIPTDVKVGDYFSINFINLYSENEITFQTGLYRDNILDSYLDIESFAPFVNGGIKIVGDTPEPIVTSSPLDLSQQDQQQIIESQQEVQTEIIATEVAADNSTLSETLNTTVAETTSSTKISETTFTKKITSVVTQVETKLTSIISETTASNSNIEPEIKEEKNNNWLIGILVTVGVIISGIVYRVYKKEKDNNNE